MSVDSAATRPLRAWNGYAIRRARGGKCSKPLVIGCRILLKRHVGEFELQLEEKWLVELDCPNVWEALDILVS